MASEAQPAAALAAEEDDYDSAIDDGSTTSTTTSINSSIMQYRQENGRTYHAYREGRYQYPNDETENDRLDLQHHLFNLTFDGKLFTAPLPKDHQFQWVLDIGTGTGIWAIDFADAHPEAKVIGVDLSPIQPSFVPPNLTFQIDDIEENWTFHEKFDFIYSRMMIGSIGDYPRLFQQCYTQLSDGGYFEVIDINVPFRLNTGELPNDSALKKWSDLFNEGMVKIGRQGNAAELYKKQLGDVGFINVVETKYIWPSNTWPKDKKMKEIGMWERENLTSGIEGWCLALFTRILGWSKSEVDIFLAEVRKEIKDTKLHSIMELYVVYGQKPPQ